MLVASNKISKNSTLHGFTTAGSYIYREVKVVHSRKLVDDAETKMMKRLSKTHKEKSK